MTQRKIALIFAAIAMMACTPKKEEPKSGAAAPVAAAPAAMLELKIGTDATYAPFELTDKDGKITGFDIDIMNEMCAEIKAKCTYANQEFDGIIAGLTAKKFDVIVSSLSITSERKQAVHFTQKIWDAPNRFAAKVGSTLQTTPEGLKGKTIGVQQGTIQESYIKKYYPDSKIKSYKTIENVYNDLMAKRVEVIFVDGVVVNDFLKKPESKEFAQLGADLPSSADTAILGEGTGFAVRKGEVELADKLNKAFDTIRANGKYKTINDKYFTFDVYGSK